MKGIGTDIVEISRIKKAVGKRSFVDKYFAIEEILMYENRGSKPEFLAASFAGKEAVSKAMGTGFLGFTPKDIAIIRDDNGKPYVQVFGRCYELCQEMEIMNFEISLSHSNEYAIAFVVAE